MKASSNSTKPQRLSREDAAHWLMDTPANPLVIGALLLFERPLSLEAVEAMVLDKLICHRRFRQHVVESPHGWSRPRWIDDAPFDLRSHVWRLPPSDAVNGAGLSELVGERMNAPLRAGASPWSFELIDLLPRGSALLFRIHHCIADGRALIALFEQLAGESCGSGGGPSPATGPPDEANLLRRLGRLLRGLLRLIPWTSDPPSVLRRRPLSGRKRAAWSDAVPLETIRAIASTLRHHVADVLLAGVAGALDRYARDHAQVPRTVHALLPVATASTGSADALGTHYASMFVSLPAAVDNPGARLELIAREMMVVRSRTLARVGAGLMSLAGSFPSWLQRRTARWGTRGASLVVSSLAGPRAPLRVAGQLLSAVAILAPASYGIGLSCTLFGYAGAIRLGVLTDTAVIDDPERLISAFRAAIDELHAEACGRRRTDLNSPP